MAFCFTCLLKERNYHEKFCNLVHVFCTNTLHVPLIIEHLAIASEECFVCWLVLPFRERGNFIQLRKNISLQCIYVQIFNARNSFHNFSLRCFKQTKTDHITGKFWWKLRNKQHSNGLMRETAGSIDTGRPAD